MPAEPLVMEKVLVLLLIALAVAHAAPGPRGLIINLNPRAPWAPPGSQSPHCHKATVRPPPRLTPVKTDQALHSGHRPEAALLAGTAQGASVPLRFYGKDVGWRESYRERVLNFYKGLFKELEEDGELCLNSAQCKSKCCQHDSLLSLARCTHKASENSRCSPKTIYGIYYLCPCERGLACEGDKSIIGAITNTNYGTCRDPSSKQ